MKCLKCFCLVAECSNHDDIIDILQSDSAVTRWVDKNFWKMEESSETASEGEETKIRGKNLAWPLFIFPLLANKIIKMLHDYIS